MLFSNSTPMDPLGWIPPLKKKKEKKSTDMYGLSKGGGGRKADSDSLQFIGGEDYVSTSISLMVGTPT